MDPEDERLVAEYVWNQSRKISAYKFLLPRFSDLLAVEKCNFHFHPRSTAITSFKHPLCDECETQYWVSRNMGKGNRLHTYRYPNEFSLRELCILVIKINSKKL
jgi:hypothetical protein